MRRRQAGSHQDARGKGCKETGLTKERTAGNGPILAAREKDDLVKTQYRRRASAACCVNTSPSRESERGGRWRERDGHCS